MATPNPLHRSIDDRFREENNGSAIRNAQVKYVTNGRTPTSAGNTNRKPARYQEPNSYSRDQGQAASANTNTAPTKTGLDNVPYQNIRPSRKPGVVEAVKKITAQIASKPVGLLFYLVIGFCTLIQMILGVMSSITAFAAASIYILTDESAIAGAVSYYSGITADMFFSLWLIFSGILLVFYTLQIILGSLMFKAVLARPLGGRGSAFKIITLMIVLISSFIPLLNILPLLWIWVSIVVLSPR